MKRIRAVLALLTTAALSLTPTVAQARGGHGHGAPDSVRFELNARVLDSGEQVVSVTLDTSRLGRIDASSLDASTFTVHAKGTSPVPIPDGDTLYSAYDEDRVITGVAVRHGDIVISLKYGYGVTGASTLGYLAVAARNVLLDLAYTITQNAPFTLANGRSVMIGSFRQGELLDPEVDAFRYGVSGDGMNYRLFTPGNRGAKRPLIVWLHGNGEGGLSSDYYNNESPLRANRGALGPATKAAQRVFGGAYVLAPQVPDTWYNVDAAGYDTQLKALIDRVVKKYRIDSRRIYLMGASAGGFMGVQLAGRYPHFFANLVAASPALYLVRTGEYTTTADQVLLLKSTPTWLVQSKDDPVVTYDNAALWAYNLLEPYGNVQLTSYDTVTWDGVQYNGHWSWIYVARNDPTTATGQHLWQWMAEQRLPRSHR